MDLTLLQDPKDVSPQTYPELTVVPPSAFFQLVVRQREVPVTPPDFVYVRVDGKDGLATSGFVATWNWSWESVHWRPDMRDEMPKRLRWLIKQPSLNIRLVPWNGFSRYAAYAGLFHLLPLATLQRFGLPPLKRGIWPPPPIFGREELPVPDFDKRLARAFSYHLWPYLSPGNPPSAFTDAEPLRVLSHNLDYWLPFIDCVAQRRQRAFGRVPYENDEQRRLRRKAQRHMPAELLVCRPLYGGSLWIGEEEAREATWELVDEADRHGKLRALVDAVRSHRVEDDFSSRWSFAREDFERKLYRKRSKVKIAFVELDGAAAVHAPWSEAEHSIVWEDFLGLLDRKERQIVVCLKAGHTKLTDVARHLGYANHSPVSKALARIRRKAERYLAD